MQKRRRPQAAVKGLKGVIAADSAVCEVDGQEGRLIYRGYNIHDLAEHSNFEEVCYLLLKGELPSAFQLEEFSSDLAEHRRLSPEVTTFLKSLPRDMLPMSALRSAVSVAGLYDPHAEETTPEANYQTALKLIGIMSTLVAAIHRLRQGKEPLEPKRELSHSGNFMYMLNGRVPTADETRAMDLILILHAEHGFNASTFAARVISATLSDWYSVITGAIGALKGPLHGGANTEVLKTLMEIGDVRNVAGYVDDVRARKGKFMGFGHAVYQVEDPRARHLKELRGGWGSNRGSRSGTRSRSRWNESSKRRSTRTATSISIRPACSITWAFRASCSRASSPPAASPAGAPTYWNNGKTTRSSVPPATTPARPSGRICRSTGGKERIRQRLRNWCNSKTAARPGTDGIHR